MMFIKSAKTKMPKGAKMLAFTAFMVIAGHGVASAVEFQYPDAVVELFTSQGCSSCPPADKALEEFNRDEKILGLGLHVDYWDRLGWKDTFASAEHTERQWQYARALGERQVYTPQAVVNGRAHLVGSKKQAIVDQAKALSAGGEGMVTPIRLSMDGDIIKLSIPENALQHHATLYAVYFNPSEDVEVLGGENAGRTLTYTNIVGKTEMIGMVGRKGLQLDFLATDMRHKGYDGCALLLQTNGPEGLPGPIIGASVITDL